MFPIREFEKRFREILDDLDELREGAGGDALEALDEMNADYEDALFVIESIGSEDEDWREAFADALAEFRDLLNGYRELQDRMPELEDLTGRLQMAVTMAEGNLGA